jgi:recombination associated protein RdgC
MGILKGGLTARRYLVEGEIPDDFRERYAEVLEMHQFRERKAAGAGEEVYGWVQAHNLLDNDFTDTNRWLYNHYVLVALRVDKKTLPSRLFKAHLEKRIKQWCADNGREKAPASIRTEQKDQLELEMLAKTLPSVAVVEFCWNIVDRWAIFHSTSDKANDRFRTLFRTTFGLVLTPFSPLDLLGDRPDLVQKLEIAGISDYRPGEVAS